MNRVVPKYESVRNFLSNLPLCDASYGNVVVKISAIEAGQVLNIVLF